MVVRTRASSGWNQGPNSTQVSHVGDRVLSTWAAFRSFPTVLPSLVLTCCTIVLFPFLLYYVQVHYGLFFFKSVKHYFERQRWKGERHTHINTHPATHPPVLSFSSFPRCPQQPCAKAGSWKQEPETQCRFPTCMAQPSYFSHRCCFPVSLISGSWSQ